MRLAQLVLVVVVTVALYYENYVGSGVAPQILAGLHMSFTYYVVALAIGNVVGALASVAAGLADRVGRANLIVYGLAVTALIMLFGLPAVSHKLVFVVLSMAIGMVEGVVLVATPALVRDFSPQVGRATAMGLWTMGPVLGSLVVSAVATLTLPSVQPDWQGQFRICGVVAAAVSVLAFVGLRELSPGLRDQIVVDLKERELVEVRARGLDVESALRRPFRQMLHPEILVCALGISLLLIIYYTAVAFGTIYLETVLGFTPGQANAIGNWNWGVDAVALLLVGLASDRLRVRKPFMVVGGVAGAVSIVLYLEEATRHPSYATVIVLVSALAVALGCAFAPWMAGFTETVEARNPALMATGLAVWGLTLRVIVFVAFIILPVVVSSASPLVDQGPRLQADAARYPLALGAAARINPATQAALAADPRDTRAQVRALSEISGRTTSQVAQVIGVSTRYPQQVATLAAVEPATLGQLQAGQVTAQANAILQIAGRLHIGVGAAILRLQAVGQLPAAARTALASSGAAVQRAATGLRALRAVPPSVLAYLKAHGPAVEQASRRAPHEWQHWYWVCFAGALLFVPTALVMPGRWRPRRARSDAADHERRVRAELDALRSSGP